MIKSNLDLTDDELCTYLAYCMSPVQANILRQCQLYRTEQNRSLHGICKEGRLAGLLGLTHRPEEGVINHVAIHPDYRRQGLGRTLVGAIMELDSNVQLTAETDQEAVNFYRKLGFQITSLGEKYPGVERFECVYLRRAPQ